jgi:hypothetical protein
MTEIIKKPEETSIDESSELLYGFNSHPQLHNWSSVPQQNTISLKGTNMNPRKKIYMQLKKLLKEPLRD